MFSQLIPSIIVLLIACIKAEIHWNLLTIVVMIMALIGGAIIQMCIFVLIGCISFWTIKSNYAEKIFYSFKDFINYPISICGREVVFFLTFIFPLGFINYYPSRFILGKEYAGRFINFMTMPVALILLVITITIWKISIGKYASTGS